MYLCMLSAVLLVLYIAGHARMTAVNYQRVQIMSQARSLREQNQLLRSDIIRLADQSSVAAWAKANGMVLQTGSAVVLSR